jgi:hypothetical protein
VLRAVAGAHRYWGAGRDYRNLAPEPQAKSAGKTMPKLLP